MVREKAYNPFAITHEPFYVFDILRYFNFVILRALDMFARISV